MIIHSWGQRVESFGAENFRLSDAGAQLQVSDQDIILLPPSDELVEGCGRLSAICSYSNDLIKIKGDQKEWSVSGQVLGIRDNYVFVAVADEVSSASYVVFSSGGEELFRISDRPREWYCAESALAVGLNDCWYIYALNGELLISIPGRVFNEFSPKGHFCDGVCLFESLVNEREYQVFDLERQVLSSKLILNAQLLGASRLPDGRILVVDCDGWNLISLEDAGVEVQKRYLFDYKRPPSKAVAWHDSHCAYMAFETPWHEGIQSLIAVSLESGEQIGQLEWEGEWSILGYGGFCNGYNHLLLNRRKLMGNGGVLVWKPEEALDPALLKEALSADRVVSEMSSQAKGKHGFHIKICDPSVNNAVRSAASEICRLIGESCSGAYNQAEAVIDRKFDGHFLVEITSTEQPNDFERGYLPQIVEYHRYQGGLSPAGSRLTLQPPEIVWHVTAS